MSQKNEEASRGLKMCGTSICNFEDVESSLPLSLFMNVIVIDDDTLDEDWTKCIAITSQLQRISPRSSEVKGI
jgi:hypothetical protein